jgi:predicted ATPase
MRKFVITGGPNSGKSSTLELLNGRGYPVLSESSRIIIEQMKIFPWDDQELFCEVFRNEQMRREQELKGSTVFLDRSLVDPVAYAEVAGVKINQDFYKNIEEAKYEPNIFLLEMLPCYETDELRKDSPEDAQAVHHQLRVVYERLGFKIVDVPLFSDNEVESKSQRVEFILSQVS